MVNEMKKTLKTSLLQNRPLFKLSQNSRDNRDTRRTTHSHLDSEAINMRMTGFDSVLGAYQTLKATKKKEKQNITENK